MKTKLGWIIAGLVVALLIASGVDKLSGSAHSLEMTKSFGIEPLSYRILGAIEILSALLFLLTRTGLLGLLLLSSYLGGAIATHLQHQQGILFPAALEAGLWIAATLRFPELSTRIKNS